MGWIKCVVVFVTKNRENETPLFWQIILLVKKTAHTKTKQVSLTNLFISEKGSSNKKQTSERISLGNNVTT